MVEPLTRTLRPPHPTDLALTIRSLGRRDPTTRVNSAEAWRASRTPDGPATVHLVQAGDEIRATAWGSGARWALDRVTDLIGWEDSAADFDPGGGRVGRLHRRFPGLRIGRTNAVFEAVLPAVIEQKVPTTQAIHSFRRMVASLGEPAPGPGGLRLQPEPTLLASLGYEEYHPFGIERRRADTIRRAAARAARLEEIVDMTPDRADARLRALPGIGSWTAAMVRHGALGDPDVVPLGDYKLPSLVAWNLADEPRADDARMMELLEPYRGHRARVVRLLRVGGRRPPRFGPRQRLTNIEHM